MQWISVNDKLPCDVWVENMLAKHPDMTMDDKIDQIGFDCLVVFADVDNGHVMDSEVVSVLYTRKLGWLRRNWKPFTGGSLLAITHWMFMPDPVSDKEAQEVYNENLGMRICGHIIIPDELVSDGN